jgi:hypothetical protein
MSSKGPAILENGTRRHAVWPENNLNNNQINQNNLYDN